MISTCSRDWTTGEPCCRRAWLCATCSVFRNVLFHHGCGDLPTITDQNPPCARLALPPDIDMSPVLSSVALPDVNALGLESQRTPRPLPRTGHHRTASGRDSSPEIDADRTARAARVRSVGRAAGVGMPHAADDASGGLARRRSRTTEVLLPTGSSSTFNLPNSDRKSVV